MKTHILFVNKRCPFIFVSFCSFISFIYTEEKSPENLEDICFDIDNKSVSIMHFGKYLKYFPTFNVYLNYISFSQFLEKTIFLLKSSNKINLRVNQEQ